MDEGAGPPIHRQPLYDAQDIRDPYGGDACGKGRGKGQRKISGRKKEGYETILKGEKDYGSKCGKYVFGKGKALARARHNCYGGPGVSGGVKVSRAGLEHGAGAGLHRT